MRTSLHGIRIAPLTGITNLRDLGGYSAAAGRTVRWKQLYRSAALNGMTDSDRAFLLSLGIRQVYDLRSIAERAGATSAQLMSCRTCCTMRWTMTKRPAAYSD